MIRRRRTTGLILTMLAIVPAVWIWVLREGGREGPPTDSFARIELLSDTTPLARQVAREFADAATVRDAQVSRPLPARFQVFVDARSRPGAREDSGLVVLDVRAARLDPIHGAMTRPTCGSTALVFDEAIVVDGSEIAVSCAGLAARLFMQLEAAACERSDPAVVDPGKSPSMPAELTIVRWGSYLEIPDVRQRVPGRSPWWQRVVRLRLTNRSDAAIYYFGRKPYPFSELEVLDGESWTDEPRTYMVRDGECVIGLGTGGRCGTGMEAQQLEAGSSIEFDHWIQEYKFQTYPRARVVVKVSAVVSDDGELIDPVRIASPAFEWAADD
jgi:hypothetical protein